MCFDETLPVERGLLTPTVQLQGSEGSRIGEDYKIAEFRQLPSLGKAVGYLVAMLM